MARMDFSIGEAEFPQRLKSDVFAPSFGTPEGVPLQIHAPSNQRPFKYRSFGSRREAMFRSTLQQVMTHQKVSRHRSGIFLLAIDCVIHRAHLVGRDLAAQEFKRGSSLWADRKSTRLNSSHV